MRSRSLLWSFNYAIEGIAYALRTQRNMRLHALAAAAALIAGIFFRITGLEFVALVFAIALVFTVELVNTAIEAAVDVATDGFDPSGKIAKDVAAGAVFIASVNALVVGYTILYAHLTAATASLLIRMREVPSHVTVAALGLTALAVLVSKALTREGTFVRGGWPSGHTAIATAVATAIGFITNSAGATVLALFVAALVAQSRVEGDAHTIPQVLLGGLLGAIITALVFRLFWM